MGIDNSDADKLKISAASDLGSNNIATFDATNTRVGIATASPSTTFEVGGTTTTTDLQINESVYFDAEVDDGNAGTADTIDWTIGNAHKSTVTGNVIYTFTAPSGPAHLTLKLVHDATATSYTRTFPATVKWAGGAAPTWSQIASSIDIVTFYFDGTSYFGAANIGFA